MIAVYRKELKSFFTNMTGVIFTAFLLLLTGIFTVAINFGQGYPNFEYVLETVYFIFLILIPILTMRSISDERHRKTDQLLYSLPMKTRDIILGKYLAMVTVFAIPVVLMCLIPPILSIYGAVNLGTAYSTLLAFFLMGSALIAVGMFFSALTESQLIAAVLSFGALVLCYLSSQISSLIPSTAAASLICFSALAILLSLICYSLTKNSNISFILFCVLEVAILAVYFIKSSLFEGLFAKALAQIAIFDHISPFISGVFDLTAIIYYLSVIFLFVFFTDKAMEQKRWA